MDFQSKIKQLKSALEQMKIQHIAQVKKLLSFDHIKLQQQIALEKKLLDEELVKIKIHYHGLKIGMKSLVKEV